MDEATPPVAVFEERQRFRQRWIVLLVGVLAVWAWVALLIALGAGDRTWWIGWSWLIAAVFGAGLPWLLVATELRTTVHAGGVDVTFVPRIGAHRFATGDLASVQAVSYHPVREFGGWGVRWGAHGARAYSVSGDSGVELIDVDGRRWVVGSRRPQELAAAVAALGVRAPGGKSGSPP